MVSPRADRGTTSPVTVRPLCPLDGCGLCCTELKPDRNPQLLPCLHSVCRECVPLSDFKTECPVCGRQYTSSEIIDNPFLPSFPTDSKPWCGGCDEPVVCGWCVECGEPLCSDCVAAHKRVKLIRNHNVLPQLPPGFSRTALCPIHKREQMKLFCVTCDQLTCRDCQLTFHKEHKYQFAQDALPEQRKCLQYLLETVRMQRGTVQQNLQDLDGRLSDLEDLQESVRTEVKDILKGIWSVLVKRAMQLSKEMQDHCWKESECVTERQVHLRKLGERQKYVLAFTEKALKSEDHTSLLSCKRWIHSELQGVLAKNPSAVSTMKELKLHCGQDIHQTVGCFGEIVTKEVPFARLNLRKTLVGPIQINPPKFSLEQQRNSRASSTLSPSSQETSSTSAGNVPLSRRQPTLMHSLSCPPSSPYPHEPERLSFYHFSPDSRGPSLQALSSSCSDSPLSLSSTSAVNATDPQRCAVNTENDDSSSLSGIALDTPVPYHGYQGGSSKSDLMVELVSRAFHVKRKAGDENVGPQIKRSCLQPLKVPADSSCEKVPPIGAEKQAGDVAVTVVMEREATPNITDQNATAPVYRQEATKASGSRQSNLVVGRSVKTVNQVGLAPFTLPVTGNSVTWGMSPANATLFPGTVNTPPSFGCVRAVPPYLVLSKCAPVSGPTGAVNRLDNGSLVFIRNDVPFFNMLSYVRGGENQVLAAPVPGGLRPPCLPDPASPKSPMEAPQSQSTGPKYPIIILRRVKNNISTVQDTKQPAQNGTAQSGLCRKDEAASTLLVHTANTQADSVQMETAQTDVDLIQADPNPTVFVMEESTEKDIVHNKTAQPHFVQNETSQAELVQTTSDQTVLFQNKTAQMEIVPVQVVGIEEEQTLRPVTGPMESVRTDMLDPAQTVPVQINLVHSNTVQSDIVRTDQTYVVNLSTQVSGITIKEEPPATDILSVTGLMEHIGVIMPDTRPTETVQTDPVHTQIVNVAEIVQNDFFQPETVQTDSAFIETVQTDSAFIETVQTDSDRAETLQNEVVQSNFNKTETVQTDPVLTEPVYAVQTDTVQMEPVHSETVLTGVVQTATLQRDLTLTDCTEIIQTDMSTTNEVSTNDTVNVVSVPSCTQEVELDLINDFCSPIEEEDDNMADFDVSAADSIEETGCQVSVGLNNRFPQVSLLWMPILDAYVGVPPTRFRLLAGIKGKQTVVQVIQTDAPQPESPCSSMSSPGSLRSTHQLRPFLVRRKHCTACRKSGNLTLCVVCGRGFHRECHIPPIYSLSTERWQCMLCRDLSDLALLQDYSETDGELCMSPPDQMRCERLLLALLCRKRSVFLYRPAKLSSRPSHYIDITMIQGRLLRKLVPPYCTPSEFVSDVWLLLHIQLKRVKSVDRLQACFEKELGKTFEGTLHPSLLVNPHQGEAERNAEQEGDKEKVTMRKNPRPLEVERAGKKISRRTQ
ncbi:uncharacterized protein LOC115175828 isoform X2 [Salmo trutta]|uniref:uncharacterized protein LOC115175828 isoform X2 n=1 Tax=Salmo trutta TaxID=8032 RepID=UPI0011305900|nr:uncharacterized protein LOC115175828 isoform X2 [Salmo trutta]